MGVRSSFRCFISQGDQSAVTLSLQLLVRMVNTVVLVFNELASAFRQVVQLAGDIFGDGFNAVTELSSGVFGGEEQ